MCGIAGIIGQPAEPGQVEKMLASIVHRGPDGEGLWTDAHGRCVLGHRRLSIIDPTGGAQPMTNEDETVWVVFNGCIYNHEEIAQELRRKGHRFRSRCDTEVIVHAYEEWGADCVQRFNGMWAFALWDVRNKTLFCSRDRIGIKPFYYAWDGNRLIFASEIKALFASGCVDAESCHDGLRQYLTFQYCLGEKTMFAGVKRLEPGHNLMIRAGGEPKVTRYWHLAFEPDEDHSEEYFVKAIHDMIGEAVRLRLRSDVPLGAHLSGGLDSSTVVSLAKRHLGDSPLKTFTGAFHEPGCDETKYAREMAKSAGAEYLETYLTAGQFADSIENIIWHMDEPSAGPGVFPQYWVSKLASEHVKVALGGQGGDEIFIGYARYLLAYLEECLRGAIEENSHRARYVATLETIVPSLPSLQNYIPMMKSFWRDGIFDAPWLRYFRLMDRFTDSQALLSDDVQFDRQQTLDDFSEIFDSPGSSALINRILHFDLKTHLQALLHVEDRTSMAWGLESRVPLLDHRLVELMASIPAVVKFKNGRLKHLFREAICELVPDTIQHRQDKMGFPVPLAQWTQGPLREFVCDVLLSQKCRERGLLDPGAVEDLVHSPQPFNRALSGALCLEIWHNKFIDNAVVSTPTELRIVA